MPEKTITITLPRSDWTLLLSNRRSQMVEALKKIEQLIIDHDKEVL